MLVLTRKCEEVIRIDDELSIKVVAIEGHKVRLGIVAPKHVKILRQELVGKTDQHQRSKHDHGS